MTDDQIAKEAKIRYPYNERETPNKRKKFASNRRHFIEGAKWHRDILNSQHKHETENPST